MVKESAVVIICTNEVAPGEKPNVKHNLKVFKKIIPAVARFACKSVLLVVTQPNEVMSYVAWKLSGFPSNRVLGIGTVIDCTRFQDYLSRRVNVARSSVTCMVVGAQGDMAVPIWSSVHVGGMKLRDINPRIGEQDDPEKWYEIADNVKNAYFARARFSGAQLEGKKGSCCWGVAVSTAEIVDAIVRNTKVVLPASTHILSCAHGTDKDVYMSVPCVIGREGVYCTVRQKLSEQEKSAKLLDTVWNTTTFLLTKQPEDFVESHRVKIVIVGSGYTGVAVGIAILFKRLASEVVFIDADEELAKAEAEDISHAAAFLGDPKILGTKDYSMAREATVCVITVGDKATSEDDGSLLDNNLTIFKDVIPKVCKYAPNSILLIVTAPVDILSYAAMKLSGFPPHRVMGLGTFLDSCRLQYFIAQKLGISASSVQASVICENGPTSVPIWSAVTVMGIKLKDINRDIGTKSDPESWGELHAKVIESDRDLITRKGYRCWGIGICAAEVVDAIVRNTCICITLSTYLKGCRHGLEKDVYMSLPCIVGRNGVQTLLRHPYTTEEQEQTENSCRAIYETQKSILHTLE
ncbi:unnamed protein product [Heterotrigona itama]|uniref:L-lactate dehydrogenase n=1 Tax=Heterotrigona itama TaxID=395501 RepID=A0A6V7HH35_9HYME|nr:unnamed protein product [Heterotrigona itama]